MLSQKKLYVIRQTVCHKAVIILLCWANMLCHPQCSQNASSAEYWYMQLSSIKDDAYK